MSAPGSCLQLDVGNSGAKWRLVNGGEIVARGAYRVGDEGSRQSLLDSADSVEQAWISSVAAPAQEEALAELITERWGVAPWFARTEARTGDLVNSYEDPERMGVDRWLAMLAARQRTPGRACVIDAGSALTIDLVSASGQHEGGYIIPGAALMERALLLDTDRVRFAEAADYALSPATSTAGAVRHGITLAQVGAIVVALEEAGGETPALFFCGGGGEHLKNLLGRGGHWVADLVFEGLEAMAALR